MDRLFRGDSAPSIAVLPFVDLSGQSVREHLADDLITDLSKISGLLVIARSSTVRYRKRIERASVIARELGARFLLDGSIRSHGDSMRVNVLLIEGAGGDVVWAERYQRRHEEIFAIQNEVIAGIARALSVDLSRDIQSDVARLPTSNLEAYNYYLRAEQLGYRAESVPVAKALNLYQSAISLDPKFAGAYAGYARVAVELLHYGYFDNLPSAVARKQAYEAASKAVELDPKLA